MTDQIKLDLSLFKSRNTSFSLKSTQQVKLQKLILTWLYLEN